MRSVTGGNRTGDKPTSGKRVVLVMVGLVALWCFVLAYLVWRGTRTPHYQRLRVPEAEATK